MSEVIPYQSEAGDPEGFSKPASPATAPQAPSLSTAGQSLPGGGGRDRGGLESPSASLDSVSKFGHFQLTGPAESSIRKVRVFREKSRNQ